MWKAVVAHVFSACVIFGAFILAGCASSSGGGAIPAVIEYQRKAALLEARIALYEGAVGDAVSELGDLAVRAGNISGGIDEVIRLFDEYQRGVDKLLRLYREARASGEVEGEGGTGAWGSVWGDDFVEDSWVYTVRERSECP